MKNMLRRLIIGLARRGLILVLIILANLAGGGCSESDNAPPQTVPQIIAQLKQQGYLKASNTEAADEFGDSVALAGDTLAVGTPGEASAATGVNGNQADNSASGSGAVYVFTRSGGVWTQQAYVKASKTEAPNHNFGISVALAGDTLAVGAFDESSAATGINGNQADTSAPGSGAVYVFTRSGGAWSQKAYVKASNTGTGDRFGESVALAGDTLAVGADFEDSAATGINGNQADNSTQNSGAVYVFKAPDSGGAGDWDY